MRYGSLFAGAGGFDLGSDAAGWECAWQVEINPHAQKVLQHWWPEVERHDDITEVNGADLPPVDVIVGGFPCQDLSVAGQRAGMQRGTRSGLFYEFARIVEEMRDATAGASPQWVIWENVAGILSLGNTLGSVYAEWDRVGAVVQEHRTIDTGRAFGVPQRRRRVLGVVGFDPRADGGPEILADPEGVRRHPAESGEAGQDAAGTLGGGSGSRGWSPDTDRMTFVPTHTGTITANGVGEGGGADDNAYPAIIHATQDPIHSHSLTQYATAAVVSDLAVRRLTPTECERLMGWPDGHTEPAGADAHRYRLCGNGVIAAAAEWIARRIDRVAS